MNFIPSIHGFKFENGFPGYPLPKFVYQIPSLNQTLYQHRNSPVLHGLCGGMCFTVCDYFYAREKIPDIDQSPSPGNPLYHYLFQRQLATYGTWGKIVSKFIRWSIHSDFQLERKNLQELHQVKQLLNQGQLVTLGIVYIHILDTVAIWLNHQVLAYQCIEHSIQKTKTTRLWLYDPNYPNQDDVVLDLQETQHGLHCRQKKLDSNQSQVVRGFFVIPYTRSEPPVGFI